nr:LysR substrate-binding domain-containing protein [Paraburkholderia xenovorans]
MKRNMALEGMGVALLPLHIVQRDLIEGRLVHAPTGEHLPADGLSVAYASRRNLAPSVRAFEDFLVEAFEHETFAGSFVRDNALNESAALRN